MAVGIEVNRPRNVDWRRAAALLYGDWGTSKAYVIGLAFAASGFASMPVIIAVCVLTAVVGYNYSIICRNFPDGGGVYSAAREQSRLLAALGALLLIANFLVTAALSGWSAMSYLGVPPSWIPIATTAAIALLGFINRFGPKHSGSMAVMMAVPTVITVVLIIAISLPHLTTSHFEMPPSFGNMWVAFTGVILALSGVEAIANMTGVMPLDTDCTADKPTCSRTASKAIFVVAVEVVLGTILLGWAMLSLPQTAAPELLASKDYMLRFLGGHYAAKSFGADAGAIFAVFVGGVFGILLLSAVNTALTAVIGVIYMMARDGDLPRPLTRLNSHGVPYLPLIIATGLPMVILFLARDFDVLSHLYEISVVGAITVSLGSCVANRRLIMSWFERGAMGLTFAVLMAVEITIAYTKPDALFFGVLVIGVGLTLRAWSHKTTGLATVTVTREVAEMVKTETLDRLRPKMQEGQKIMVAARGATPVLRFALDEALLRKATLCVLYVKEIAVILGNSTPGGRTRWQDDPQAAAIMNLCLKLGEELDVCVQPIYAVSSDPASTILDLTATLGVDYLMLGSAQRFTMAKLLKGDVVARVAAGLPEDIQLIIHG
jgi:amino acid transporter